MKKIIFWILFLSFYQTYASCSLSTTTPVITPGDQLISVEWKVKWACWETPNEFKVYYYKDWNWLPVTTVLAWLNQAKYVVDWDVSDITDWSYKVRILQSWDNSNYLTSKDFIIDRIAPIIRDDLWILPSWWEFFRWKVILKWNKESIFDSYKLPDNPISFQYSLSWSWSWYVDIVESVENSWVYVWDTAGINWEQVTIKIIAKDEFWNMNFDILDKNFSIDNIAPSSLTISKINDEEISDINYLNVTPTVSIANIDSKENYSKVMVYDINTEKIYSTKDRIDSDYVVQLDPMNDWEFELAAIAIDKAWNSSIASNVIKIVRDSFPPKAPVIKSAWISNWTLRVNVESIDENDIDWWKLLLMNWDSLLKTNKASEGVFDIGMIGQGIYNLTVMHKDLAWNISDKSNTQKVIYDTKAPENVSVSIPLKAAIYGNVEVKMSATDNVWIKSYDIRIDWETVWVTSNWSFELNTKDLKNWNHKISALAYDVSWKTWASKEYDIIVFNSKMEGHWANKYIRTMFESWHVKWEANSWEVNPEASMNRASALKLIMTFFWHKLNNVDLNNNFIDVSNKSWYWPYVSTAFEKWFITWFKPKHKINNIKRVYDYENIYNLQFLLKGLWYNLEANGEFDSKTIGAVWNYQKYNDLRVSWSLWLQTATLLNQEELVRNKTLIEDKFTYFRPATMINRVQALKMVIEFSWIEIPKVEWLWYAKYTDYAKKKWIMVWNPSWDLMLENEVTIWQMSKILLKVKDAKEGR